MINGNERAKTFLQKEETDCLKGILAICVLLCHLWGSLAEGNAALANGVVGKMLGVVLMAFGYLAVAMFLFMSGYGLIVQYQKRGEAYIKTFLQNRVLPLYILCVLLIVFYWIARTVLGETVPGRQIVQSFLFGNTVISKGWYLQTILVWYLLVYGSLRFFKTEKGQLLALVGAYILYVAVCLALKLEHTWYQSAFCLPLGAFWAMKRDALEAYFENRKRYVVWLLLFAVAFAGSFLAQFAPIPSAAILLVKSLSASLFVIFVTLAMKVIPVKNFATVFLGKINLEIYTLHGFVLMLLHSKWIYIKNWFAYSVAVIAVTILLAWAAAPVFKKILQIGKKRQTQK